jgi:hypothetical protein
MFIPYLCAKKLCRILFLTVLNLSNIEIYGSDLASISGILVYIY